MSAGYTRPAGLNILGETASGVIARYSLSGHLDKVLAHVSAYGNLQAAGACGTLQIFRQAGNGSITRIAPPHTSGNNNVIVTTSGSRMLVRAETGCPGSMSLLWYDPRTHAEQWLMKAPGSQRGVVAVVPYYGRQNAPAY
jgi:hypothetical protein